MSRTYKATGINLKSQALGESDRLVTILTREFGLIRAVAPGARKHNSSLGGRSGMFVGNDLLIAKGRSLDKITQAQTIKTYPGLAKNLGKLAAGQYLAEIVLCQALSEQPQEELYELLNKYLAQLEELPKTPSYLVLAHLAHAVFHFLGLAGLTPQVQVCCLTGRTLTPDKTDPQVMVGFSPSAGGVVCLTAWEQLKNQGMRDKWETPENSNTPLPSYETVVHRQETPMLSARLNGEELSLLQMLPQPEIMQIDAAINYQTNGWLSIERILRSYVQYHFSRPIRSAVLIDSYFAANHDATF